MEKDQIFILEERGLLSITGSDTKDFLQNILSNDITKVDNANSIFSAILTPQGKCLYEFFVIKSKDGYLLECDLALVLEIVSHLTKYKLRSKIEINDLSKEYFVGVISREKFGEIQKIESSKDKTIIHKNNRIFLDPRSENLGARVLSTLQNLHLTIKNLSLKIANNKLYLDLAFKQGVPVEGVSNLKDKIFALEANFEELNAIDFKKGCYVGQENTARMKLKNKIRKRLLPIYSEKELRVLDEVTFDGKVVGKVLIVKPRTFAVIKLLDPDFNIFKDKDLYVEKTKVKISKNPIKP